MLLGVLALTACTNEAPEASGNAEAANYEPELLADDVSFDSEEAAEPPSGDFTSRDDLLGDDDYLELGGNGTSATPSGLAAVDLGADVADNATLVETVPESDVDYGDLSAEERIDLPTALSQSSAMACSGIEQVRDALGDGDNETASEIAERLASVGRDLGDNRLQVVAKHLGQSPDSDAMEAALERCRVVGY